MSNTQSDRSRVAASDPSEVRYFANKHGLTSEQVLDLIKEHGNDRAFKHQKDPHNSGGAHHSISIQERQHCIGNATQQDARPDNVPLSNPVDKSRRKQLADKFRAAYS